MERWEKIQAVQQMQDYIHTHLKETITLKMLARAANYSPWHSARIFKELTGKAPFDYIRALRLSHAAMMLQEREARIVDVAFDFVFGSHEGFTRAFSKQFGVSPLYYSKHTPDIKLFIPSRIHEDYLTMHGGEIKMSEQKKASTVFVQVVDRPARKVILKRGMKAAEYFEYCKEVGCDVWDVLTSIQDALYEPIGMWIPANLQPEGTSHYVQGVEMAADYAEAVPEGFEIIDLPPCKMMVFQGQPYDDEKFSEAIGELWSTMNTYNPELYGFEWADEDAPRFQLAPLGYRGYIEARPVRPLVK
ncbi:helix-turn-helix domain-containing protein [Paenibacillus marinisediminis]